MIVSLVKASSNRSFRERTAIALNLREGRVIVEPDSIAELRDGTVILRRLRMRFSPATPSPAGALSACRSGTSALMTGCPQTVMALSCNAFRTGCG